MTHCDGYRAAALAYATDLQTIGIDAEPHNALPDGVLDAIALPREQNGWQRCEPRLRGPTGTDCCSAQKESVYKAWFPLAARWLVRNGLIITAIAR